MDPERRGSGVSIPAAAANSFAAGGGGHVAKQQQMVDRSNIGMYQYPYSQPSMASYYVQPPPGPILVRRVISRRLLFLVVKKAKTKNVDITEFKLQ